MATKAQKRLASLSRARTNATKRARENRGSLVRRASNAGVSYAIGSGVEALQSLPTFFGQPRTVTLAALGAAVSMYGRGTLADVGEGALDAGISLTLFQMGMSSATGQPIVAGLPSYPASERLEADLAMQFDDEFEDSVDGLTNDYTREYYEDR